MSTLTIKTKSAGWWHAQSQVESIQNNLKKSIKEILERRSQSVAMTYNEVYCVNITMIREMARSITNASEELKATLKFPTQFKPTFEMMAKKIQEDLSREVGQEEALKFNEAFDNFMHPNVQPKVPMQSVGR